MAEAKEHQQGMSLTTEQLQALITAAVTAAVVESKKPAPPTEREIADIQQAQDMRLQQRDLTLLEQANKAALQRSCTHMRAYPATGTTAVFVENGTYIICQQCQGIIRPGQAPKDYVGADVYDTNLFNRLYQLCNNPATF